MTKVVYNNCYGGFSLSVEAQKLYLKLKGITDIYQAGSGMWMQWVKVPPPANFDDLPYKERNKFLNENYYGFSCRNIPRDDPILVQVVENLGRKADGECAELEIEDVTPGTLYRITNYDGYETVETQCNVDWEVA